MAAREIALKMTEADFAARDALAAEVFRQVVERAAQGDSAAFEQIVALHERRVLLTAYRLLGSLHDAQDAAQEVLLRMYRHLRRFDASREMAPWLYRVTVNVCRDLEKKRRKHATLDLAETDSLPSGADVAGDFARLEQRRKIQEALKSLPEKERAAVVLRDLEGLATKEVAEILGSSEGTVRSQLSKARVKIKKFMERAAARRI